MANSPRDGNVYLFDWKSSASQFFTLGLYAPKWQRAKYPALPAAGRFEYEIFDPMTLGAGLSEPRVPQRESGGSGVGGAQDRCLHGRGDSRDGRHWPVHRSRGRRVGRALPDRAPQQDRGRVPDRDGRPGSLRGAARTGWNGRSSAGKPPPPAVQVQWSVFDNETGERRILAGETSPATASHRGRRRIPGCRTLRRPRPGGFRLRKDGCRP